LSAAILAPKFCQPPFWRQKFGGRHCGAKNLSAAILAPKICKPPFGAKNLSAAILAPKICRPPFWRQKNFGQVFQTCGYNEISSKHIMTKNHLTLTDKLKTI
jgi:hypothetical protein